LEDLEVDGRIILKYTLKIGREGWKLTLVAYGRVNGGLLWPWNP
jgi:hypothetical protein